MKRFVLAIALVCAVSSVTLAGDIPSGGSPQPPAGGGSTAPGDISTPGYTAEDESESLLLDTTVSGLLTLFRWAL